MNAIETLDFILYAGTALVVWFVAGSIAAVLFVERVARRRR